MLPEEFKEFEARIHKESIPVLLADPKFHSTGGALVQDLKETPTSEIPNRRSELYAALHIVSFIEGLDSSLVWLRELIKSGLSGPIAAIAATQVCRRLGDYGRASTALRHIYYMTGESSYVSYFYGQALAAIGDFPNLAILAQECLPNLIKKESTRDQLRWSNLLLNMGLHEEAGIYVNSLPQSGAKALLLHRLGTYSESASLDLSLRVINLDSDTRKWRVSSGALTRGGYSSIERHSAVSGRRLPVTAMKKLVSEPKVYDDIGAGAVGCWLSHHAVWESIVEGGQEWTLVAEDDATPYVHSSYLIGMWKQISSHDLVWVNDRMSDIYHQSEEVWNPGTIDNWQQLESWPSQRQGWGTDGYLVNQRGAEQLLEYAERSGIQGHVDGQMGAWTTLPHSEPKNRIQREILGLRQHLEVSQTITSTCLRVPAIKHSHFGVSATASLKRDR